MISCLVCGEQLHAANWWHDAAICNKCGENIPLDAEISIPEAIAEINNPIPVDHHEAARLRLLQIVLGE